MPKVPILGSVWQSMTDRFAQSAATAQQKAVEAAASALAAEIARQRVESLAQGEGPSEFAMIAPSLEEVVDPSPSAARPLVPVRVNGVTKGVDIVTLGGGTVHASRHGLGKGGYDDTIAFQKAVAEAKMSGAALVLPAGDFTITAPSTDITGIRAIEGTQTILRFPSATSAGALRASGTRTLLAQGLTPTRGTTQVNIGPGHTLHRGQTILFVSGEPFPLSVRSYSARGERNYVADYDAGTGLLTLVSPLIYTYRVGSVDARFGNLGAGVQTANVVFNGCTIYAVTEQALSLSPGLTIVGPDTAGAGIVVKMMNLHSACRVEKFGYAGIVCVASHAEITGTIFSGWYAASGDSYGVAAFDLSRVKVSADVYGGRHAIASGGGGEFPRAECGSTLNGSSAATLALPSVLHVTGCEVRASSQNPLGAIDAHVGVEELIVTGCVVHEGVQASARKNRITGSTIYHQAMSGVYLTGITPVTVSGTTHYPYAPAGEAYGDLVIDNCRIESVGPARLASIQIMNGVYDSVVVRSSVIRGAWDVGGATGAYKSWLFLGESVDIRVKNVDLDVTLDLDVSGTSTDAGQRMPRWGGAYLSNGARLKMRGNGGLVITTTSAAPIRADLDLDLQGWRHKVSALTVSPSAGTPPSRCVEISGEVVRSGGSGVTVTADKVVLRGNYSNNGQLWVTGDSNLLRSGIVTTAKEVTLDGVTASDTQTTPTQATAFISQRPAGMTETSWVDLLGLDARGNRTTSRPLTEEGYSLGAGVKTRRMRDVLHQDGRPAVSRFDVTTTVLVGGTPTTLSFAQVAAQVGRATYTGTVAAGASVQVLVNVRGATALWGHMARAVDAGTGTGVAYVPASWSLTSAWTEPNTYTITLTNTSGGSIALRDTTVLVSAIPA